MQLAPGNSGGPLANARGEVVGINTMIAGGVGLAVPSNSVARLLKRRGAPAPLGVVVRGVRIAVNGIARLGLAILEVAKNSAAEQASLLAGDIVIGASDRLFESMEDFELALDGAGERLVRLQFLRDDRSSVRTVAVRLGVPGLVAA